MVREIIDLEAGYVHGIATGRWVRPQLYGSVTSKEGLLQACAAVRQETRRLWPQVTAERLLRVEEDPTAGRPTCTCGNWESNRRRFTSVERGGATACSPGRGLAKSV